MTVVDPIHAAEISKALSDYDAMTNTEPRHPTQTTKGSVWVNHADGTTSHWQIRRPMSMREVKRGQRRATVDAGRKVQAGILFRLVRKISLT